MENVVACGIGTSDRYFLQTANSEEEVNDLTSAMTHI